jgi:hypothetical protein
MEAVIQTKVITQIKVIIPPKVIIVIGERNSDGREASDAKTP